jgi:hypothetical protein
VIGRARRHPDGAAVIGLALLAIVLMGPYLLSPDVMMWPRSGLGSDLTTYNWSPSTFIRQQIAATGHFPLWWDTTLSGLPMVGNPGVRVLYPPMLLAILAPTTLFFGFACVNAFNLWIAGIGMYVLAGRGMSLNRFAAFAAALVMLLTPRLSANVVGDMGYTAGLCWTPLTLACVRLALDRRSWRWGIAGGLCLGLLFTLNFVNLLYLAIFVGVYALLRLVETRRDPRGLLQLVGVGVVLALFLVGAAAYMLFPFLTFLPYQSRQTLTLADANYLALPLPFLFEFLYPSPFKFPEWTFHVGLLPLVLALVGLRHRLRREVWLWVVMLLFSLIFALGTATPLYGLFIRFAPGFSLMRVPARMLFFVMLALIALSALGIDAWMRRGTPLDRRWLAVGALFGLITIAARLLMRRPEELDWLLGLPAALSVVIGLLALSFPRSYSRGLLALCLLVELFPLAVSYARLRPFDDLYQVSSAVEPILADQQQGDVFRVFSTQRELGDHLLTWKGLQSVDGLNSFQFAYYADLMRRASGCPLDVVTAAIPACASTELSVDANQLTQPNPALLGLLNVRYLLASFDLPSDPALHLLGQDGKLRVYSNDAELPRAFAVGQVLSDSALLDRVDPREAATVASKLDVSAYSEPGYAAATLHQASGGLYDLTIDVPRAMVLVVSATWTPGWQATVDGQPAGVLRVDSSLLGVALTPGVHHVQLTFAPPAFTIGVVVTAITGLAGGLLIATRKRRPI